MPNVSIAPAASVLVLTVFSTIAQSAVVTVPNAFAATLGNGQTTEPLAFKGTDTDGKRYQQVYASSQFSAFSASESITKIAFRAKQGVLGSAFGNTAMVSNIVIRASTTAASDTVGLSAALDTNVGANVQTVYSGALTLTTASQGTTAIGYVLTFQTPFTYNKAAGNLLLDFIVPAGATFTDNGSSSFSQFDTVTDTFPSADGISSAFAASANASVGSNSTTGLVTQFTSVAVPEPTSAALLCLGALVMTRRRRGSVGV